MNHGTTVIRAAAPLAGESGCVTLAAFAASTIGAEPERIMSTTTTEPSSKNVVQRLP